MSDVPGLSSLPTLVDGWPVPLVGAGVRAQYGDVDFASLSDLPDAVRHWMARFQTYAGECWEAAPTEPTPVPVSALKDLNPVDSDYWILGNVGDGRVLFWSDDRTWWIVVDGEWELIVACGPPALLAALGDDDGALFHWHYEDLHDPAFRVRAQPIADLYEMPLAEAPDPETLLGLRNERAEAARRLVDDLQPFKGFGATLRTEIAAAVAAERRDRSARSERHRPSFQTLKRLSFTHSAIYFTLLTVWLIPGLHGAEFVFGLAHGLGWIAMCVLCLDALRRGVISMGLTVAVTVIGGIGPFVGSYAFVREEDRRRGARSESGGGQASAGKRSNA